MKDLGLEPEVAGKVRIQRVKRVLASFSLGVDGLTLLEVENSFSLEQMRKIKFPKIVPSNYDLNQNSDYLVHGYGHYKDYQKLKLSRLEASVV